jgi:hypothetical protein
MIIKYPECVIVFVALIMQLEKRMRRIMLSSVTSPALPYFSTLSYTRHSFEAKKFLKSQCVLILPTAFV